MPRQARRARGRRRTSRRSRRAAPARCRCCWWPSRGGCAARGSAARAGRRARRRRRRDTPTSRPGSWRSRPSRTAMKPACGPPKPERHAEPLRGADRDVGAALARRAQEGQGEQVGGDGHQGAAASWAAVGDDPVESRTAPLAPGYCTSTPEALAVRQPGRSGRRTTSSMPSGSARVRRPRWSAGGSRRRPRNVRRCDLPLGGTASSPRRRRWPRRAATRWRWQTGEVGDDRLEVEQRLEPALGDLRLVRRVRGVPAPGSPGRCAGCTAGVIVSW